jgi:hypothetical protein
VKETRPTTDHLKFKELLRIKDEAPLALDPLKSALIIVDVQRGSPSRNTRCGSLTRNL